MTAAITTTPRHLGGVHRGERPAARHPASVYRRRRAVVGIASAAVVAVTSVLAVDVLAGSSGAPASAVSGQPALERSTMIARPGDTLWSIAEAFRGDIPINTYVDQLITLNDGPSIQAGQRIIVP